ncbi:uncharacterized protein BDV17DRAFT_301493 [Aspergillus undulatus]|uniref:uncharacterized protein n=1 Tax=Aspergillus undulatus TaxID=1810928 RepID=UPI003CCE27F7
MCKESPWVKKRHSESARAKAQQRLRRRKSLFKKAAEFSLECESDVIVAVRIQKSGQIYMFESSAETRLLSTLSNLVGPIRVFLSCQCLPLLGDILSAPHPGSTGGCYP